MKATVDTAALKDAAAWASKRVSPRPHYAALSGVLLTVRASDTLTLDALDISSSGSATVACDAIEPGEALVSAATLARIAGQLPGPDAKLHIDGPKLRIASGTARFGLHLMDRADFPALPACDAEPALLDGDELARVLAAVVPAVDPSNPREVLLGVHFAAAGGRLTLAATDAYRLHVASMDWPGPDSAATIPVDLARAVAKTCAGDKTEVAIDTHRAAFGMGARSVTTGLVEGVFPDWPQLLPASREHRVTVAAADLADVVRRCAVVGTQRENGGAQLTFGVREDAITVSGADRDDEGTDEVAADTDRADLDISLAHTYVLDAIAAVAPDGGDITVDLRDELKPVVLRAAGADGPDDPLALVMPIRL